MKGMSLVGLGNGRLANGYFVNGHFEAQCAQKEAQFSGDWHVACFCQSGPAFSLPFSSFVAAFYTFHGFSKYPFAKVPFASRWGKNTYPKSNWTEERYSEKTKRWLSGRGWEQQFFSFQSPAVQWMTRTSSLNCLSCRNPYQSPHSLKNPFLHWKVLRRIPFPKIGSERPKAQQAHAHVCAHPQTRCIRYAWEDLKQVTHAFPFCEPNDGSRWFALCKWVGEGNTQLENTWHTWRMNFNIIVEATNMTKAWQSQSLAFSHRSYAFTGKIPRQDLFSGQIKQ